MQDLFETYETLPKEVQEIINDFSEADKNYNNCQDLVEALEQVRYTCEYGLDATPYDLKKLKK